MTKFCENKLCRWHTDCAATTLYVKYQTESPLEDCNRTLRVRRFWITTDDKTTSTFCEVCANVAAILHGKPSTKPTITTE